jgi:hypothetical protein
MPIKQSEHSNVVQVVKMLPFAAFNSALPDRRVLSSAALNIKLVWRTALNRFLDANCFVCVKYGPCQSDSGLGDGSSL